MSDDALMTLPDGAVVPASVVARLVDMEFAGVTVRRQANGLLWVGPRERVTADDLAFCRAFKSELIAIVAYLETCEGAPC